MIVCGVDLGGRKVAISTFVDGELTNLSHLEVAKTTRARELREIAEYTLDITKVADYVFVEEPLVGRGVRASMQVSQAAGAVLAALGGGVHEVKSALVPVGTWKKEVIGSGSANKDTVKDWLREAYPVYATLCGSNQDRIDATCIGLYGVQLIERADALDEL